MEHVISGSAVLLHPQKRPKVNLDNIAGPDVETRTSRSDPKWIRPESSGHWMNGSAHAQIPWATVTEFVETKFIPEHVAKKRAAGRAHYRAILKHVLEPQDVDRIFRDKDTSKSRLKADPTWPYLGNQRLGAVRPDHVRKLLTAASERGYSARTIMHIRNAVSMIFSHAKKSEGYSGANPALLVKVPQVTHRISQSLTLAETGEVLKLMRRPEREMALMIILTGMNLVEVCGLQWKCVNLTGAPINDGHGEPIPPLSIAIRKQWQRGGLADVIRSRNRNLEIPELLLPALLILKGRASYVGHEDYVFASRTGSPVDPANIRERRLRPIGEKLRVPGLSWHEFHRIHVTLSSRLGREVQYSLASIMRIESLNNEGVRKGRMTMPDRRRSELGCGNSTR